MFSRTNRFLKSGYNFGRLEGAGYPGHIETAPLPDKVIIPLKQGFSAETDCLVNKGDHVRAGQIIGRDDHTFSSPVHSSINGTVEYFETFMEGHEPHFGVVVRRDHEDEREFVPIPGAGSGEKTREEISEMLYLAGVTALGPTGIPSLHHTSDLGLGDVKALVVNGLSAEPFSLPQDKLLAGKAREFSTGIELLMRLLGLDRNVHIALPEGTDIPHELEGLAGKGIKIHLLENRYPFDMDEVLTEIVTGERVPDGGTPSEVGAVVLTLQDFIHVYEAVVLGKPLIERIVAVGGPGLGESRLLRVPVGSQIGWLLAGNERKGIEGRLLAGGAMRGIPVESAAHPVERTLSALTVLAENREREFLYFLRPGFSILSFSRAYLSSLFRRTTRRAETNLQGERRPCIYCSYCEDICPRGLAPHIYSRYVRHGIAEDALKYGIEGCIECGLCSFACPSKITLMEDIKRGKVIIGERGRWSHPTGMKKLEAEGKL